MAREHPLKTYNHKPVCTRTYQWLARHKVPVDEIPSSSADAAFGVSSHIPRATAILVKLINDAGAESAAREAFVLVLLPAHQRVNLTAVRKACGGTSAFISPPDEVARWCNAVPGCVPPIVHDLGIRLVLDPRLFESADVYAASGRPGFVVRFPVRHLIASEGATFLSPGLAMESRIAAAAAAATRAFGASSPAAVELGG